MSRDNNKILTSDFNLDIDYSKDEKNLVISHNGSSGSEYDDIETLEDVKGAIEDYMEGMLDVFREE